MARNINICDNYSFSNFGWSVDINKYGSGIIIGAPKTNINFKYGSGIIIGAPETNIDFKYDKKNIGITWVYFKYRDNWRKFPVNSPNFTKNGEFGKSVAIDNNNSFAIGEPFYSNLDFNQIPFNYGYGGVHLYSLEGVFFPNIKYLTTLSGNGSLYSQFGYSIDLNDNGDILIVGAPTDIDNINNITGGKVYIYKKDNIDSFFNYPEWTLTNILTGVNNFGYFGKCVKINSGNLIVVAENESFHIYDYINEVLTETSSFSLEYENFQTSYNYNYNKFIDTNIEGDLILIGNPYHKTGVARLYKKNLNVWENTHLLTGNPDFQFFGSSVGLSNL